MNLAGILKYNNRKSLLLVFQKCLRHTIVLTTLTTFTGCRRKNLKIKAIHLGNEFFSVIKFLNDTIKAKLDARAVI